VLGLVSNDFLKGSGGLVFTEDFTEPAKAMFLSLAIKISARSITKTFFFMTQKRNNAILPTFVNVERNIKRNKSLCARFRFAPIQGKREKRGNLRVISPCGLKFESHSRHRQHSSE
jgi:hypothetical protein